MPDHVHGIRWIANPEDEEANSERGLQTDESDGGSREARLATSALPRGLEKWRAGTRSTIIGCFKAAATRRIHKLDGWEHVEVWQSSFHDHIIRNRTELRHIRQYIRTNPQRQH